MRTDSLQRGLHPGSKRVYGGKEEDNSFSAADTVSSYNKEGYKQGKEGSYENALEYYYHAIKVSKTNPDVNLTTTYEFIGHIKYIKKEYEDALRYYNLMLSTLDFDSKDNKTRLDIGCAYKNIGSTYKNMENYDDALTSYNQALEQINDDEDRGDDWIKFEEYITKKIVEIYKENNLCDENSVSKDNQ